MLNSLENENKLLREENEKLKQQLKISEYALIQKDRYYQQILDSVKVNIYWKDFKGRYLGTNQSNLKTTRFERIEDIIGKTDDELYLNKSFGEDIVKNDSKVLQSGRSIVFEEVNKLGDKEVIYLSTKSPLKNEFDEIIGLVGVSVDITKNKKLALLSQNQQLQFQQILDSIDVNIYWKDMKGRFLGINKKQLSVFKGLSYKDVVGKLSSEIAQSEKFAENIYKNDLQVIKSGKSISFEEEYIVDGKNEGIYFSTKSPLKDKSGKIVGLVGIGVDITDRKQMQNKIEEQNKELKKKDVIKTQFIENFSHDVKVPINALVGRTQLLKLIGQKEKNEKLIEVATDTENSAMVLDILFKQMQNIIIHEQFDTKIYNTTFNLFSLIDKEIEIAKASISSNKKINIHLSVSEDLSIDVYTDHYKLSQIIRNLLSNAIKYTDEGNIDIQTEIIEENSKQVIFNFKVSDTGIGIHKAHQDNIFELFNRANITSHNNNRHGMGIGLYIVKNNVDLLGGNINFESHVGQGSRFLIEIPLCKI